MSGAGGGPDHDSERLAGMLAAFADHTVAIVGRDLRVVASGGDPGGTVAPGSPVAALAPGHAEQVEAACRVALGGTREASDLPGGELLVEAAPLRRDGDTVVEVVVALRDISLLRDEQRLRRYSDHQYRNAFEHAPVAMVHVDRAGRCQLVNDAMASLVGLRPSDLQGREMLELLHPGDRPRVAAAIDAMLDGSLPWYRGEDRLLHAGGPVVLASLTAAPISVEGGGVTHILMHLLDVTDQRDLEVQLRALVDEDPLTNLRNRRSFEAALNAQCSLVARYGGTGAVLVLDLDRFKQINDLFGHHIGDELIVQFAGLLRATLRTADIIGRMGGDEFAVVLPETSLEQAEVVASKLVASVKEKIRIPVGGQTRPVTTSIGVARFDSDDVNGRQVLMRADLAMYEAKNSGRDRYATYQPGSPRRSRSRSALVERIENALSRDHFVLDAQRVVDLRTGAGRDYELLLRLHDSAGAVPPAAFLGVAEQAGLLGAIDRWVLGAAVDLLSAPGVDPDTRVTVNVSPATLTSEDNLTFLEERFRGAPTLPGRLALEVAESALVAHLPDAETTGERLRRMGVQLSLDEFRAGFGAFSHLRALPIVQVKIDGRFVRACLESPADRLVVRALVSVAHGFGKRVVAEYVEDEATVQFLLEEDVDCAQGFHLGAPFPSSELLGR
ncbi:EAL domain-containing protein [Acidiferrimicrobium sp. IK]|uniref:putative bifunctional diguanylate cyclase/phosphodiesterase n=1 Tax=Acidiferrimicrobium sp. IK TaxID=2871700 RepID=UPI0021CB6770|nr:EAL domain-containing protein [Acidiferrimicrobium sp. IK]MCU4187204.1 EAL domain-containing protein [Acidiferrimicrobium sp. IK]